MKDPWWLRYITALFILSAAFAFVHGTHAKQNLSAVHWEDRAFLTHSQSQIQNVWDAFSKRGFWPGLYRPISTNLYYFVGRTLSESPVPLFHVINVLSILANAFLLLLIAQRFASFWWALLAATIFLTRQSQIEIVLHTCEFQVLSSTFFGFLALLFYFRNWRILALLSFTLGLFCKETILLFPLLLLLHDWRRAKSLSIASLSAFSFWIFLRALMSLGGTGFDYTASIFLIARNLAAYFLTFFSFLIPKGEEIMPVRIMEMAQTLWLPFLALLTAALTYLFWTFRSKDSSRGYLFGLLLSLVGTLPYLFFVDRIYMRYAYVGHAGMALTTALLLQSGFVLLRKRT